MSIEIMKLGLVLEGGGVKGAYHIGALKALLEAGYRFDGVAGTSIGALNAAMIAQGEFDKLVQIWNCVEASDILDVDTEMFERLAGGAKLDKPTLFYFVRLLRSFPEVYKNSTEKMRAFVRENLNEDKIRRSPMDFGLVTVSLPDFEPHELMKEDIPMTEMDEYVIASANFPLYKLIEINGKRFIDGGVWDNMPVNLLARQGYRRFIVIRTSSKPPKRKFERDDLQIDYIVPSEPVGKTMQFTAENIQKNQKLGYYDTVKFLKGYVGERFYIHPYGEHEIIDCIAAAPRLLFFTLSDKLEIPHFPDKHENVAAVACVIRAELGLTQKASDSYCFLTLFELFGALYGVEKFTVYEARGFMNAVLNACQPHMFCRETFFKSAHPIKSKKLKEIFFALAALGGI